MTELTLIKNLSYIPAFLIGVGLDLDAILALAVLMVIDTIFGITEAGLLRGWKTITSARAIRGIVSKLMVLMVPSVLLLTGYGSGINFEAFVRGTITLLILSEAYSILGHVYSVHTGKQSTEFDAVAFLLTKIQNFLKTMITDDKIEEIEKNRAKDKS